MELVELPSEEKLLWAKFIMMEKNTKLLLHHLEAKSMSLTAMNICLKVLKITPAKVETMQLKVKIVIETHNLSKQTSMSKIR